MYVNKYETETELLINKQVFINIYILLSRMLARRVILILKNNLKLPSTQNVCYDIESFECVLVRSSNEKALT